MRRWLDWRAVVAFACVPVLFGCAVVDSYSGRAVDYNREAEQATEQALLLNVVRASLRRPMQFTSLQSITGSANVSGSVTGGGAGTRQTPYVSLFPQTVIPSNTNTALSALSVGNASGTASLSGSATFTVPVLDTQEFYQGILQPIPLQAFDFYLQQGYPAELLIDLFVAKIVVMRLDDGSCRKFTFQNSVRDDLAFGQFQAFADYLVGSGFSSERVNSVTAFGPPISPPQDGSTSTADTARLLEAYSKASGAGLDIRRVGNGANATYRVQKKTSQFRFCFAHRGGLPPDWIANANSGIYCGAFAGRDNRAQAATSAYEGPECVPSARAGRSQVRVKEDDDADIEESDRQGIHNEGISEFRGIRLAPELLRRINQVQDTYVTPGTPEDQIFDTRQFENGLVSFKIYTRSTEGIIYYLGEITRKRLFPEAGFNQPPRTAQFKNLLRFGAIPLSECNDNESNGRSYGKTDMVYLSRSRARRFVQGGRYTCENLFVLEADYSGDSIISVNYDGRYYAIPRDPEVAGRTTQVLELVKQLLALNTSAKQLPSTSVISVVGAP